MYVLVALSSKILDTPGVESKCAEVLDFGFWVLGFGVWGLGFGFRVFLDFGFWILDFGFRDLGFGVWGLGFGIWDLGFGFGILGFGFGVLLLCIRDDCYSTLEVTQGQNDSFVSQLPYKCYLEEVASVGD